jgi:hypothetical protein
MDVDILLLLAINNLLMFWSVEGGCVTCDWKNNIIIINNAWSTLYRLSLSIANSLIISK